MGDKSSGYQNMLAESAQKETQMKTDLYGMYKPYISQTLGLASQQLSGGLGQAPQYVQDIYKNREADTRENYSREELKSKGAMEQQWKQQGMDATLSPGAKSMAMSSMESRCHTCSNRYQVR